MKFFSRITKKPNSVIKQIKAGDKVVDQKRICVFKNGVCETDDPGVIAELEKHPDKFRTDKPWPKPLDWKDTEEGKKLFQKGIKLGINKQVGNNYKNIRKEYLEKLIAEKEIRGKTTKLKPDKEETPAEMGEISYQEIIARAKKLDIPTNKRKKVDILEDIRKKEVMTK